MLKIKNDYISLKNIKHIELAEKVSEYRSNIKWYYLKIIYFDGSVIKISIDNYKEYEELSKIIAEKVGD